MNITGGIILFAVLWFLTFLMILPIRHVSQAEAGEVVPGTPASAPANAQIGRKARITTLIAAVLWVLLAWAILFGGFTIHSVDWFGKLPPETPPAASN
ncbi:MAG: DUF1467 family protein [Proteobacteria bacterium]|nr:DUF1467 family protein [Pseudomonadota bacterium]MBS0572740.1 DUF1467 family protein [Pseudomonadota bacterium]